jgi:multidrug resistance efflux pump
MKNARDVRLKLLFAALCLGVGFVLLNTQGGLAGSSIPAYVESIDHAVAPVVTGRIAEEKVKLGEVVKAGQVLLTLEDRAVRLEHERVLSELAQSEPTRTGIDSEGPARRARSSSALAGECGASRQPQSRTRRVEKLREAGRRATETAVRREYRRGGW